MNFTELHNGTQSALPLPNPSAEVMLPTPKITTTGDLLARLAQEGARSLP